MITKRVLFFVLITTLLWFSDLFSEELSEKLDEIENEVSALKSQIAQKKSDKNKFRITGSIDFRFTSYNLTHNPLSNTISSAATIWEKDERGLQLLLHYSPFPESVFHFQIRIDTPLDNNFNKTISLLNDFYIKGEFKTPKGNYNVFVGGPFWELRNSYLTLSGGSSSRTTPFERYPWTRVEIPDYVYDKYINEFSWMKTQKDTGRLGAVGAKGAGFNANEVLKYYSFSFFHGYVYGYYNTHNSFGFGNVGYKFKENNNISFNYKYCLENSSGTKTPDKINQNYSIFQSYIINDLIIASEIGISHYKDNIVKEKAIGYALIGEMMKNFETGFKLKLNGYYVHPDFVAYYTPVFQTKKVLSSDNKYYENILPDEDIFYNNRWALSLKTGTRIFDIRFDLGLTKAFTIEETSGKCTFSHHLNHFEWFTIYDQYEDRYTGTLNAGYDLDWKGAYEQFNTIFSNTKKSFNRIDVFISYDFGFFTSLLRSFYIGYKWSANGISSRLRLFSFRNNDLLDTTYQNLFFAFPVFFNCFFVLFSEEERFLSEKNLTPNDAIDQIDKGTGIGIDYVFMGGSAIYLKAKKVSHKDFKRNRNNFEGIWLSFEIKSYF